MRRATAAISHRPLTLSTARDLRKTLEHRSLALSRRNCGRGDQQPSNTNTLLASRGTGSPALAPKSAPPPAAEPPAIVKALKPFTLAVVGIAMAHDGPAQAGRAVSDGALRTAIQLGESPSSAKSRLRRQAMMGVGHPGVHYEPNTTARRLPDEADAWVDRYLKDGRADSVKFAPGTDPLESTDCSKYVDLLKKK